MKFGLYKMKLGIKKSLINAWYWMMKPIAYFFTIEKINQRYQKKQSKITEEQAIKWIAEDIVRYLIKHPRDEIGILICDYANEDHFWNDCTLLRLPYYLKREKTRMAFYKFKMSTDFQEKIIEYVKSLNVVRVSEKVAEYKKWQRVDNYKKTVFIESL